jgi:Zn-dependent M28 family amino/carboxypeptidase
VAEIRGAELPDEIVLVGAHLDSWDLGTGANDNGVNCAIVIEMARSMRELGLKPRRTVRFVLFTGEEEGMIGSAGYVARHHAELDKHVAVVILDIGSGRIQGFFLNGRPELGSSVDAAIEAAKLPKLTHVAAAVDGTDNFDFMLAGVPNLVASQDPAPYLPDYHAESDTFDKVDLPAARMNAAIAGAVVWGLANQTKRTAPRQSRIEVDALLKATGIDQQMKAFGQLRQ